MQTHDDRQLSLDQAYQAAYLWLDHVGDPPLEISEPAHGAVELITETAFVRVRSSETPVEQSSVLALLRAAQTGKRLVIFSPSGFSPGAKSIAETQGIALYTLDTTGRAIPETTHARSLAPETEPDPPFAPTPGPGDDDYWAGFKASQPGPEAPSQGQGIQATTGDWTDCPNCGATHYRNAKFCRECGTSLLGQQVMPTTDAMPGSSMSGMPDPFAHDPLGPHHARESEKLRCRTCGSHDIEHLD
ncbi:MAG: zinc-ribbon domain-containing protein [Acidimicrobiia bacterium]|nr:zinc-ribbon domain-containing protein [Acidimicrobiia bacterium]